MDTDTLTMHRSGKDSADEEPRIPYAVDVPIEFDQQIAQSGQSNVMNSTNNLAILKFQSNPYQVFEQNQENGFDDAIPSTFFGRMIMYAAIITAGTFIPFLFGVDYLFFWPIFGIVIGISVSVLSIREGIINRKGFILRVGFLVAGLLILYEVLILLMSLITEF